MEQGSMSRLRLVIKICGHEITNRIEGRLELFAITTSTTYGIQVPSDQETRQLTLTIPTPNPIYTMETPNGECINTAIGLTAHECEGDVDDMASRSVTIAVRDDGSGNQSFERSDRNKKTKQANRRNRKLDLACMCHNKFAVAKNSFDRQEKFVPDFNRVHLSLRGDAHNEFQRELRQVFAEQLENHQLLDGIRCSMG